MAIYEYECRQCGEKFELRRMMTERDEDVTCPRCKTRKPRRVVSLFGGVAGGDSCGPVGGGSGGG